MKKQRVQWSLFQKNPIQFRSLPFLMLVWSLSVFQNGFVLDVRSEEQTAVNTRPVTIDSVSDNHWAFVLRKDQPCRIQNTRVWLGHPLFTLYGRVSKQRDSRPRHPLIGTA